jgi:tRNA(His) guanylyltransferase
VKTAELEDRMRSLEWFHDVRLLPGAWSVIRVDGRSFSRLTEGAFEKPFDARFHAHMVATAEALVRELQGVYAFTESDEISVLFRPDWRLFDRELEKLVSISASIAAATFSLACGRPVQFDARVWLGVDEAAVIDYFRWRQADGARCALNGWCYWTLRKAGRTARQATAALDGASLEAKRALLLEHGVRFDEVPTWQRHGAGLWWERRELQGWNPVEGRAVTTTRRRLRVERELPAREAYAAQLRRLLRA